MITTKLIVIKIAKTTIPTTALSPTTSIPNVSIIFPAWSPPSIGGSNGSLPHSMTTGTTLYQVALGRLINLGIFHVYSYHEHERQLAETANKKSMSMVGIGAIIIKSTPIPAIIKNRSLFLVMSLKISGIRQMCCEFTSQF